MTDNSSSNQKFLIDLGGQPVEINLDQLATFREVVVQAGVAVDEALNCALQEFASTLTQRQHATFH